MDSHHSLLLLLTGFLFVHDPCSLKATLLLVHDTYLLEIQLKLDHYGIGSTLSPVHFRGLKSWRVGCYALLRG